MTRDAVSYSTAITASGADFHTALQLLSTMKCEGLKPTVVVFNSCLRSLEKANQGQMAADLLASAPSLDLIPDRISYNSVRLQRATSSVCLDVVVFILLLCATKVISACSKSGLWKTAINLLEDVMPARNVAPDEYTFASAISAQGIPHKKALQLFMSMESRGVEPNIVCYNSALSICARHGMWQSAFQILKGILDDGHQPDVISWNTAIASCERHGKMQEALDLLDLMVSRGGAQPDTITFSSAISACRQDGAWGQALFLLDRCVEAGLAPNVITLNAVLSTFKSAREWKRALDLLDQMKTVYDVFPDVVSYNTVFESLDKAGRGVEIVSLMNEARARGLYRQAFKSGNTVDLHGCSAAVARAVMRVVLNDLKSGTREASEHLVVVTGRGLHSRGKAILPQEVRAFIRACDGPATTDVHPGHFVIEEQAIAKWIKSGPVRNFVE